MSVSASIYGVLCVALTGPPSLPPLPGSYESAPAEEPSEPPAQAPVESPTAPTESPQVGESPLAPTKPDDVPPPVDEAPPPASPTRPAALTGAAAAVEPPPFAVELPSEFEQKPPAAASPKATPKSARPDPAGVVLDVPAEEPKRALPGDPSPDVASDVSGADGPIDPAFENVVAVRTAVERSVAPPLTFKGERSPPERGATFVFGYRTFAISDALSRRQTWHVGSLELTPLRRYARFNLITEVGWEGGEAAQRDDRADFMLMQKVGVGAQYPHWLTPLVEFQAGIGAARIEMFERNDLALLYSLGVDGGAQWAVTKRIYLMALVGWIRPHFAVSGDLVYYDRVTFKVGVGF